MWESSVPLDWVGLRSAKLDLKARLQDSSVTDPVTGKTDSILRNDGWCGILMLWQSRVSLKTRGYKQKRQRRKRAAL